MDFRTNCFLKYTFDYLMYKRRMTARPGNRILQNILFDGASIPLYSTLHGERSVRWPIAASAQAVGLSIWQEVHGLGILYLSVMAGEMNRKVWA